jgi:predicted TIM-barrel fold metal-dependent hydrolase
MNIIDAHHHIWDLSVAARVYGISGSARGSAAAGGGAWL